MAHILLTNLNNDVTRSFYGNQISSDCARSFGLNKLVTKHPVTVWTDPPGCSEHSDGDSFSIKSSEQPDEMSDRQQAQ
jgi:hypothetical protein